MNKSTTPSRHCGRDTPPSKGGESCALLLSTNIIISRRIYLKPGYKNLNSIRNPQSEILYRVEISSVINDVILASVFAASFSTDS